MAVNEEVGERIEALLSDLRSGPGADLAAASGEELVRLVVGYYGDALARLVAIADVEFVHQLAADPMLEGLLILHGLHPLGVEERIEAALERVRPYLGSHAGGVAFLGVEDGVAHLRLDGSCHGCASSSVTVRTAIEEAVLQAAPEVSALEVEGATSGGDHAGGLLQIGLRPPGAAEPDPVWLHPSALELPGEQRTSAVHLDGRQVFMARRNGALYAYTDSCAACGASLVGGSLVGDLLTCPSCSCRFDIRLAGKAVDGTGRHLDPLPLLDDVSGIRVALQPEAV